MCKWGLYIFSIWHLPPLRRSRLDISPTGVWGRPPRIRLRLREVTVGSACYLQKVFCHIHFLRKFCSQKRNLSNLDTDIKSSSNRDIQTVKIVLKVTSSKTEKKPKNFFKTPTATLENLLSRGSKHCLRLPLATLAILGIPRPHTPKLAFSQAAMPQRNPSSLPRAGI